MIEITGDRIELNAVLESCEEPEHGARLLFLGVVRNHNHGRKVRAVSYDIFAPLARSVFERICSEARSQWGEELRISLVHRVGTLEVGEVSVAIAVGAAHRHQAYQASRFVIEKLKERAPIWKKELYEDGESDWLQGHSLCDHGSEAGSEALAEPPI